jgi:F-type H+-transporting ATPase subunit delta
MNDGKITVRYAKALYQLSVEKKVQDKIYNDMQTVMAVLKESPGLKSLLESPVVPVSKKVEITQKIFTSFDKITLSYFQLMITNRREQFLGSIARQVIKLYRKAKGIQEADIQTAIPLNDALKTQIKNTLKGNHTEVMLDDKVNPSIIGGYILRLNDIQFDASVASKLKKIRQELDNTSIK